MSAQTWHDRYPISVGQDELRRAADRLMDKYTARWDADETVHEDLRVAFTQWLEQHIQDVLDEPWYFADRTGSGFKRILDMVKKKHRARVESMGTVAAAGERYKAAMATYYNLWSNRVDGGLPMIDPSPEEEAAGDEMDRARNAYLAAVQRALTLADDKNAALKKGEGVDTPVEGGS